MSTFQPWPSEFKIDSDRINLYLLNIDHPDGYGKAKFFLRWGFDLADPIIFVDALLLHPEPNIFVKMTLTAYGDRYVFIGPMHAPKGVTPPAKSVWQTDNGSTIARLLTAYPV